MGKRLIRIFHEQFGTQLSSISGKKVNLVFKDKSTLHGEYLRLENNNLLFQDTRGTKHSIQLDSISEIVYDKETAY